MPTLHPLAAAAAGSVLALAALTAPNTVPLRGLQSTTQPCSQDCVGSLPAMPTIGDAIPESQVHLITEPGRYGLSLPPEGDHFAIVAGQLVRVSAEDSRIVSILRPVLQILD